MEIEMSKMFPRKPALGRALLLAAAMAGGLAACATGRISDDERLAIYRANAGEPVRSFRYFGRLDGWTSLGGSALAVWTRPHEAYLLELGSRCPDLDFAMAISITNQGGSVYSRFDKVLPLGQGAAPIPCFIQEIRPLDTRAIKAEEAELREAKTAPREDG
ncbi:hypothetical protein C9I47_1025 [Lysobacter maris]|uniref:Lipoprotein n=3 Tax=Marilutibacter maris TaxID=1605891 RepID=A0A2U9T565_9GAMM|nr:hypothetical protein C9I47_1025 [Lysobacter maris]